MAVCIEAVRQSVTVSGERSFIRVRDNFYIFGSHRSRVDPHSRDAGVREPSQTFDHAQFTRIEDMHPAILIAFQWEA